MGQRVDDRDPGSERVGNPQLIINDLPVLEVRRVDYLCARNQRRSDQHGVIERKSVAFEYCQAPIMRFDSHRFNGADSPDRIENLPDFDQGHL